MYLLHYEINDVLSEETLLNKGLVCWIHASFPNFVSLMVFHLRFVCVDI